MRRMTLGLVGTVSLVLVVAGVSWAVYGPASAAPPAAVTSAAPLHEDAIVVDGHVHITTAVFHQRFDPWQVQQTGLWDYARAKQGGLNVVIEMVYIEDPYTNYNYSVKQACRLIELFYQILDANPDKMELALTSADARRIVSDGKMAVILALEGGFDMEGDLDVLRLFHRLGVRLIQFTNHDTANAMTDAWVGEQPWGGISDHGRAVIREMNRLGIMIDISHSSEQAQYQIIEASEAPVVDSHTSLSQFSSRGREMSNELLQALAAKGGMMAMEHHGGATSKKWTEWQRANRPSSSGPRHVLEGMNLFRSPDKEYSQYIEKLDNELHDRWKRPWNDRRGTGYGTPWRDVHKEFADAGAPFTTDAEWAEQAVFVTNLVGDDHIGIGLDMMSGTAGGLGDFDATSYGRLTDAMLEKDLSERTVRKVLGGNWLRLLDAAKVPASQ